MTNVLRRVAVAEGVQEKGLCWNIWVAMFINISDSVYSGQKAQPKNHSTPCRSHISKDQTIYLRIFLRTEYQWIMPLRVTNKQKEFEVVFFSEECKSSALRSRKKSCVSKGAVSQFPQNQIMFLWKSVNGFLKTNRLVVTTQECKNSFRIAQNLYFLQNFLFPFSFERKIGNTFAENNQFRLVALLWHYKIGSA